MRASPRITIFGTLLVLLSPASSWAQAAPSAAPAQAPPSSAPEVPKSLAAAPDSAATDSAAVPDSAAAATQSPSSATRTHATSNGGVVNEVPTFDLGEASGEGEIRALLELLAAGKSVTPPLSSAALDRLVANEERLIARGQSGSLASILLADYVDMMVERDLIVVRGIERTAAELPALIERVAGYLEGVTAAGDDFAELDRLNQEQAATQKELERAKAAAGIVGAVRPTPETQQRLATAREALRRLLLAAVTPGQGRAADRFLAWKWLRGSLEADPEDALEQSLLALDLTAESQAEVHEEGARLLTELRAVRAGNDWPPSPAEGMAPSTVANLELSESEVALAKKLDEVATKMRAGAAARRRPEGTAPPAAIERQQEPSSASRPRPALDQKRLAARSRWRGGPSLGLGALVRLGDDRTLDYTELDGGITLTRWLIPREPERSKHRYWPGVELSLLGTYGEVAADSAYEGEYEGVEAGTAAGARFEASLLLPYRSGLRKSYFMLAASGGFRSHLKDSYEVTGDNTGGTGTYDLPDLQIDLFVGPQFGSRLGREEDIVLTYAGFFVGKSGPDTSFRIELVRAGYAF